MAFRSFEAVESINSVDNLCLNNLPAARRVVYFDLVHITTSDFLKYGFIIFKSMKFIVLRTIQSYTGHLKLLHKYVHII